jgi:hypothetical protein
VSKINVGKVVPAGILAGIVLGAFVYVSDNFLLAEQWLLVAQVRNIDPNVMGGNGALIAMVVINLVLGMVVALTYAAIRPRFGAGPGTAAIASFLVFLPQTLMLASMAGWFISWDLYFRQSVVTLVSMIAAGFAAGWVYAVEEDPVD